MRVSIDINGVLRDTISKIEQVYIKWYIEPNVAANDEIDNFEYKINKPIDSLDLSKHFLFPNGADGLYDFLYNEYPMEIFGHAGSVEYTSMNDLNDFYFMFRDKHEIKIISDEMGKSKPATLFFLSKFGCLIESVSFYNTQTIETMWDSSDIILTANPNLINEKRENKTIVKYNSEYNANCHSELSIDKFKEFTTIIENTEYV